MQLRTASGERSRRPRPGRDVPLPRMSAPDGKHFRRSGVLPARAGPARRGRRQAICASSRQRQDRHIPLLSGVRGNSALGTRATPGIARSRGRGVRRSRFREARDLGLGEKAAPLDKGNRRARHRAFGLMDEKTATSALTFKFLTRRLSQNLQMRHGRDESDEPGHDDTGASDDCMVVGISCYCGDNPIETPNFAARP